MKNATACRSCEEDAAMAASLAAIAHPARIAILRQLARRDACCCKEVVAELDLAQSTVSQHLKVMVAAGLVDYRPEKQRSRYSVNHQALAALAEVVSGLARSCGAKASQPTRMP
jgi:DNA-binding transcriptional ArsR family regulator